MDNGDLWCIIINPTSGNGSSKRKWPKISGLLKRSGFRFEHHFTKYHKHSVEITKHAVSQGVKKFICVGGDGTLHNVVNGIMQQSAVETSQIAVGVIPIGTGNDWVRTYGIPKNIEKSISIIAKQETSLQDIGKIELNDAKQIVYFNNLAGIGFDGLVAQTVEHYKSLGAFAYIAGALMSLFKLSLFQAVIRVEGQLLKMNVLMALVGICRYSGGGMRLTDKSDPSDGYFDISIADNFGIWKVVGNLLRLFNGKITSHKNVHNYKSSAFSIEVEGVNKPFIQADGELIGRGGFTATSIPRAIAFYCNPHSIRR